ncbi:secreted protein [Melampsora americana]|nr:secreted protein [Melampsora americana]
MHFTLPSLALLSVFQAVVALPTSSSVLDTSAGLNRRQSGDQTVGAPDDNIKAKCFGGMGGMGGMGGIGGAGLGGPGIWGPGGMPFSQNMFNGLMAQNGLGNVCSPFMGNGFQWGQCNAISQCPGACQTFNNVFLPQFAGGLGGGIGGGLPGGIGGGLPGGIGGGLPGGIGGGIGGGRSIFGLNDQQMKSLFEISRLCDKHESS